MTFYNDITELYIYIYKYKYIYRTVYRTIYRSLYSIIPYRANVETLVRYEITNLDQDTKPKEVT